MTAPSFQSREFKGFLGKRLQGGGAIGFIILIFLGACGSLYYGYITDRQAYLTERNFRVLATWSGYLTTRLVSYAVALNTQKGQKGRFTEDEESGRYFGSVDSSDITMDSHEINIESESLFNDLPEVRIIKNESLKNPQEVIFPFTTEKNREKANKDDPSHQETTKTAKTPGRKDPAQKGKEPNEATTHQQKDNTQPQKKNGEIIALTLPLVFPEMMTSEVFSDVLLVNQDREVKFQKDRSGVLVATLKEIQVVPEAGGFFGFFSDDSSTTQSTEKALLFGSNGQDSNPVQATILLGGTPFKIFTQPVEIPGEFLNKDEQTNNPQNPDKKLILSKKWILCGLIPLSTYKQQYMGIPLTFLIMLVFALLSLILSLPLARLILMDPRERLTGFNVISIGMAAIVGVGVLTFGFLDWLAYSRTKDALNRHLKTAADQIHDGFQTELNDILKQLEGYGRTGELESDLKIIEKPESSLPTDNNWVSRPNVPCSVPSKAKGKDDVCHYDHFLVAFWVDQDGQFRVNWTQGGEPYFKGTLDLNHRLYIRHVLDSDKSLFTKHFDGQDWAFYIDPIISLDTAEKSVVVSMPLSIKKGDKPWVAAIEQRLISLMSPHSVPPGGGFAVINNQDGQVLFHSNPVRSLREHFFQETEMNAPIRALVHAGSAGFVEGDYWGKGHQFFVRPVEDLPWTLIVFREKEDIRGINFGLLLFGGSLFTVYLLSILIAGGLGLWMVNGLHLRARGFSSSPFDWLWPHPDNRRWYQVSLVVNLGLILVGWLMYCRGPGQFDSTPTQALWIACLIPLAGLSWLLAISWFRRFGKPISNRLSLQDYPEAFIWYALLGMSWLLVFAAFPAGVIFGVAQKEEAIHWVQRGLLHVERNLEQVSPLRIRLSSTIKKPSERTGIKSSPMFKQWLKEGDPCIPKKYSGWSIDMNDNSAHFGVGVMYPNIVYPTKICFLPTVHAPTVENSYIPIGGQNEPLFEWFHRGVLSNALHLTPLLESWAISPESRVDPSLLWRLSNSPNEGVKLILSNLPIIISETTKETTSSVRVSLSSPLPEWPGTENLFFKDVSPSPRPVWIFGVMIALVMVWVMIRAIVVRVFAIPFPGSHSAMLRLEAHAFDPEDRRNLLILGPPGSGKSSLPKKKENQGMCEIIDMRNIGTPELWRVEEGRALGSKKPIIVVDHFEHAFGSPPYDQKKWHIIERLLSEHKTIHILSTLNPLSDGLLRSPPNSEPSPTPIETGPPLDWASLLRGFALCYYRKHPSAALDAAKTGTASKVRHFQEEAGEDEYLSRLGEWVLGKNRGLEGWVEADIVPQWLGLAKPYYQAIWESCSLQEQMALYHLAKDGLLHAFHPEFPRLFLKGLIQLRPNLRLMNNSFRLFILSAGFKAQLDTLEKEQVPSAWNSLKRPLLLVLAGVVLFLFGTQEELKNSFNAILGVIPFLLPMVSELLGHLGQRGAVDQSG